MRKIFIAFIFVIALTSCGNNRTNKGINNRPINVINDSIKKQKTIESQMALGDRPDSEQDGPSFKDVVAEHVTSYNKIEHIDKIVVDGPDTLQVHLIYFCLHDSSLVVPKKYIWSNEKNAKDFVTHNFASKIILIRNRDTVLNRIFKKADFNNVIYDQLKKYAILFNPDYIGYNQAKKEFAVGYSISIPLTDVGVPAFLIIDKKGNYKIMDEYAKINGYKKD